MAVTREQDERPESFAERRRRMDENCRKVRDEQNRLNGLTASGKLARAADDHARDVLGRLRRSKLEIDPGGSLPAPRER